MRSFLPSLFRSAMAIAVEKVPAVGSPVIFISYPARRSTRTPSEVSLL